MFPAQFEYHRAGSAQEAIDLLGRHQGAKLLAGGHSLLPMMKLRLAQPPALIDIGRLGELAGVTREGDSVRIGALTCHADVAASEELKRSCPLIAEAAGQIGDPQVRNRGTVGGNIAHADPASDLPAVLVATGASVHLLGAGGSRQVAAKDFFQGLLTTALAEGEIITHVTVPVHGVGTGSCYLKVEHPASGYAVCGAAAVVTLAGDGRCTSAALCFNGVADVPADASAVAAALVGSEPTDAVIEAAVHDHLAINEPLGDLFASGEYRVHLARIHGRRALQQARDRARG